MLQDCASNAVQLSSGNILTTTDAAEAGLSTVAEKLLKDFCGMPSFPIEREARGRTLIRSRMKEAFERAGVWGRLDKAIPVSEYTLKGDPLKIDCGYEVPQEDLGDLHGLLDGTKSLRRLFHAVALTSQVDTATVLGYAWEPMRKGMQEAQSCTVTLAAIVEDGLDRNNRTINFAIDFLQQKGVSVSHVSQLPEIAERARRELRL
jgi:hypothetical protein